MRKTGKRWIALILVLTVMISVTGCGEKNKNDVTKETEGKKNEEKMNETDKGEGGGENLEPLEISIGYWDGADRFKEDDAVLDIVEKKFNITLTSKNVSWSDFKEKYKLWAAAGELPDVFATDEFNSDTYMAWVNQEVIKALPEDLSAYPNIEKLMKQKDVKPINVEGKYYMIPRITYSDLNDWRYDRAVIFRKDWLKKMDLEIPKTFEEYKKVLKAFVENDPDGNGLADTVGLTHKSLPMFDAFYLATTPQLLNGAWLYEDGRWVPPFVASTVPEGIKQMRELYKEGVLDKDFAIMKNGDGQDKFAQGKTGVIAQQVSPSLIFDLKNKWDKYEHDVEFKDAIALAYPWGDDEGKQYSFVQTTFWSESYFNAEMSDEKMERILMLYDWLLSPEWKEIKQYGIEGVDYKKEKDDYRILLELQEDGTYPPLNEKYPSLYILASLGSWDSDLTLPNNSLNRTTYGEDIMDIFTEFSEYSKKNIEPMPTNFDVKVMPSPGKSKVAGIAYNDDIVRLIMSDEDIDKAWAETLKKYEQQGLTEAIEEVTAKVKELGIKPE